MQLLKEMLTMSSLPHETHVACTWHNWSHHFLPESGWASGASVLKRKTTAPSYLWFSQDSWRMPQWQTIPEEVQTGWGKLSISLLTRAALWTQTPLLSFTGARHHHSHFQGPAKTESTGNAQEVIKQPKECDGTYNHIPVQGILSDPWLFLEVHIAVCLGNFPHTLVLFLFFSVPLCCHLSLLLLNWITKTSWRPCEF